jgi:hypothetical protein
MRREAGSGANENMILFVNHVSGLAIPAETFPWASLWQIKVIILLDNVVGPCVRTVIAAL